MAGLRQDSRVRSDRAEDETKESGSPTSALLRTFIYGLRYNI